MREAGASLERYKMGRPIGRLDGIPVSWKDVFDVEGTPTTAGSALLRSAKPAASDAPVVARLAQAGAVSIGKTNLSEFAFSGIGLNPHFGTPANPLVQGGIPGGSSSGAAVSVAIGACAVAFGTDTSGSIRVPAACNGLVGFKPTASRYPLSGVFPLAPSLDTVGIIAKSMADIIVVDDVLTERQTKSPGETRESATFVVPESVVTGDLEPAVAANFEEEIKRLERAGFRIVRRRLKSFEGTQSLFQEVGTLVAVEAAEVHRDILSRPELLFQIDQRVARRLQAVVRAGDAISRLGGDEFALVLRLDMDNAALDAYSQRIADTLRRPFVEVGQQVTLTCSAGIAIYPDDAADMDSLVSNADTAMYRAKDMGKNRCVRFEASMNQAVVRRQAIEHALRAALQQGHEGLALHYQPLYAAADKTLVGAEALLRWSHPELGAVSPLEAVMVAEDCGLIVPLGYWVLRTACRDAARWQAHGPQRVSVNVSARQLGDPQFLERVMDILREERLPASLLEIELTETVLMDNMEAGAHTLHRLSQLGIHLAIDDFGTGYSSLAYLRQLPMRRLKVDRSFVKDLPGQEHSRTIVNAIVALAHGLGLHITAEGVETPEQADYLVRLGCDVLQGYLFARPMPVQALEALLVAPPPGGPA